MDNRLRYRLLMGAVAIAALATVGYYSYNLGVARGGTEMTQALAATGGAAPAVVVWPRPWGHGFGFFPVFPLFFILFWVFVARRVFWRGAGWGRSYRHDGVPPAFDEWHRRAHAQQGPPPAP